MTTKKRKGQRMDPGGWIAVPASLMESRAWITMNLKARRALDELLIKRGRGRPEHNPYVVTYADVEWARAQAGQSRREPRTALTSHLGGWA